MAINKSAKGRRSEYKSIKFLEALGYYCTRAAGSKGLFDIVGISQNEVILLQVKSSRWPAKAEIAEIQALVVPHNARKIIHCWKKGQQLPLVKEL